MPWRHAWEILFRLALSASSWHSREKETRMAKQLATNEIGKRRFRWRERLLFLVPFIFLLLEMFQLPLSQYYKNNIDLSRQQSVLSLLPTVHDLIPIIGFLAVVVVVHIVLTIFFPKA